MLYHGIQIIFSRASRIEKSAYFPATYQKKLKKIVSVRFSFQFFTRLAAVFAGRLAYTEATLILPSFCDIQWGSLFVGVSRISETFTFAPLAISSSINSLVFHITGLVSSQNMQRCESIHPILYCIQIRASRDVLFNHFNI